MLAFLLHQVVSQVPHPVLIALDAAGLALFAVAGTAKALDYHLNALSVALMGTITGAGGGVVRTSSSRRSRRFSRSRSTPRPRWRAPS
jgi:uncharacterized membrane protein YeiH